jgi:hypothetical protein
VSFYSKVSFALGYTLKAPFHEWGKEQQRGLTLHPWHRLKKETDADQLLITRVHERELFDT